MTIADLRYQAERTPHYATKLALAQGLYRQKSYREAQKHFAEALRLKTDDREALYGMALTQNGLRDYDLAIESLEKLIDIDPAFRDYAAWTELAHALCHTGRNEDAFELLDRLVTRSPRLKHRVAYAHYLMHGGRRETAREQLETGLLEHHHAPKYIQRMNKLWIRPAEKMLKKASMSADL